MRKGLDLLVLNKYKLFWKSINLCYNFFMIKFENVSTKYVQDFFCLYNFNTEITNHTLFVGDDFFGSSAILRLLSKIDKGYSGNIFIDNVNLKEINDKDLQLAYLPKCPVLFENKNAFENLYYSLKIRKIDKNTAKNMINNAFLYYNLQNLKNFKHADLSIKKIYALVRAVIRKPKYILIENFFENLDEKYFDIVNKILTDAKEFSTLVACEKQDLNLPIFKNFNRINLGN